MTVIVVGGGWAGSAAALSARKQGAEVTLIERTDMLLGTGLVGGIMRNNGRYTATEEMMAMSGGEIFQLIDGNRLHKDIEFPGHHHASLYNVATMEPIIKRALLERGITIQLSTRITDVEMAEDRIQAAISKKGKEEIRFKGDVYIDATGTAGPPANCSKYGNGCAMCVLRCHSFGGRVSITAKAGVQETIGRKGSQVGAMSGSCKIFKESLSREIRDMLDKTGVAVMPLPQSKRMQGKLAIKACQQYALPEFEENVVLLDTGHAKLMSPFFPLEALREIPGFENARYEDPYAGGLGNSIRYVGMAPRDNTLKVEGIDNLFCAGEKAGLLVGHTEAICSGTLAGYNAVKHTKGEKTLALPESLAVGDAIQYVRTQMQTEAGLGLKYTFSGSVFFERMKDLGLYSTNTKEIEERVGKAGMAGIFESR
ncbi:MAG: FAD-dependent oxidoreductase [Deltaproteobacteria bacterium]|nr:MAG: FAD-dependent oxidoreductase [Deltaproteobacteria bacterium]